MNNPINLSLPERFSYPINDHESLQLTADYNSVMGRNVEFNTHLSVNGESDPATDVYLGVESRYLVKRFKIFMPMGIEVDPVEHADLSVDNLITHYKQQGGFNSFSADIQQADYYFNEMYPRFSPEKIKDAGGALLHFTHSIAGRIQQIEQSLPIEIELGSRVKRFFFRNR